jgi:hypothetical protein
MQNIPRTDFIESTSVISAAFTVRALRIVLRTLCSLAVIIVFASGRGLAAPPSSPPATFCNPLELPYRFQLEQPVRREAADPTMVFYKGEWWLFASKSGGYWHTADFANWKFVEPTGLPLEDYAPTAEIIAGRLYFSSGHGAIYTSDNPVLGIWQKLSEMHDASDIDLFADDDGRVYEYCGCSDAGFWHAGSVAARRGCG